MATKQKREKQFRKVPPPPPEPEQASLDPKKVIDWATLLWSFVPSSVAAVLVGMMQALAGLPGIQAFAWGALAFAAVAITLTLVKNLKLRIAACVLLFALAAWGLYKTWLDSMKYELEYVDFEAPGNPFKDPEDSRFALRSVTIGVIIKNPNSFPVKGLSIRRYASVARVVSGDEQEDSEFVIPATMQVTVADSTITFPGPWRPNTRERGTIDFAVCFARYAEGADEVEYDKMFRMKGTLIFAASFAGDYRKPVFIPAEPNEENLGFYDGCHR